MLKFLTPIVTGVTLLLFLIDPRPTDAPGLSIFFSSFRGRCGELISLPKIDPWPASEPGRPIFFAVFQRRCGELISPSKNPTHPVFLEVRTLVPIRST
jgi:hypothetical protein